MRTVRLLSLLALAGCGGGTPHDTHGPDETGDLNLEARDRAASSFSSAGTTPAGPDLGGTRWRFVEAACTEGPLDLAARGFAQQLRVSADGEGLLLTYDQLFATEQCTQTVVQRARPTRNPREWVMVEEARVAQPATDACEGRMEDERPGEVRRNGDLLEVLVQRSMVWCNGFEVRMVYARMPSGPLANDQIGRHWAAHFNRRDPNAIAALFADTSSIVDPFLVTSTGGATRIDGRDAVRQWYVDALTGVEWLALRLEGIENGPQPNQIAVSWSYVDPRVLEPFRGKVYFTIAAGEIYENRFELTDPPPGAELPGT